jgi:amidase
MSDRFSAFVPGTDVRVPGAPDGPLAGLTFAVKDLFDVAGHVTGCGNPDWAATHPIPERTATAVTMLLAAGAGVIGKTITDEISLGLLGINRFDGTPLNPRAPDRVPGGSSSGSASAVAAGLCDFALGTDSGGSVRIPASFCGLYGLRPTHGRIPIAGMMTQSPTFDTVGFFARDAETFSRIGEVLLGATITPTLPQRLLIATDCFETAEPEIRAALHPALDRLSRAVPEVVEVSLGGGNLAAWSQYQRILQMSEFHATFRDWIDRTNPRFSAEVAGAFADDGRISDSDVAAAKACRADAKARIGALLDDDSVLCLPTSPILPIRRDARLSEIRAAVHRIVDLTAIAGLSGVPQMNLPFAAAAGIPVGLSLIGRPEADARLLAIARGFANQPA